MSQRRMIYSSIWTNEDFGDIASSLTDKFRRRLLYIGSFSLSDDDGRVNGSAKYLRASLFPYDNLSEKDIEDDLVYMASKGFFSRYEVDNKIYIQHQNWERWQKIRKDMYKESDIPPIESGKIISNVNNVNVSTQGIVKIPKGKHSFNSEELNDIVCYEISEAYNVDLEYVKSKREAIRLYCGSNAKQYADYKLTLMNWIRRDIEDGKAKKKSVKVEKSYEMPSLTPEQVERSKIAIEKMKKDLAGKLNFKR